jgi:hypothetical protein
MLVCVRAAADEKGKTVTVKGTLVDTTCFLKYGYSSDEHDNMKACGKDCLKDGTPAGVLVNGKLYILIFPSRVFANYVGKTVEVTGDLYGDNLLHPRKASVIEKKETKTIKLAGQEMM